MTAAPLWPRIGDPGQWTHLTVTLEGNAPGLAGPAVTFEIWSRYPSVVIRESVEGRLLREVSADKGSSAPLDVERRLCLFKTGLDPREAYEAAIAIAAGPVAELYGDGNLPDWWQRRAVRGGVAYENAGPGALRQATIDPATGLPLEAITVDGRLRWSIRPVGSDPPPAAPDVTDWAKESHERTELAIESGPVERVWSRSTSLPEPLEFIADDRRDSPTRVVIQRGLEQEGHFRHPDGRVVTVLAGDHQVAQRLVAQVAERLGRDRAAPEAAEDARQWDERINELVRSLVDRSG